MLATGGRGTRVHPSRIRQIHRRQTPQRLVQQRQHARQILALLLQRRVLLHQTLRESLVVDVAHKHVVDALHRLVQEIQRDALSLTPSPPLPSARCPADSSAPCPDTRPPVATCIRSSPAPCR